MVRLLFIIIGVLIVLASVGQSLTPVVVATGGGTYQNNYAIIDITIGETVTETIGSDDYILTQGFQQGHFRITDIETILTKDVDVQVFPNPTNGQLNISFFSDVYIEYYIHCYSNDGKLILKKLTSGSTYNDMINLSQMPPGTYYLEIVSTDKANRKTCKIIKE